MGIIIINIIAFVLVSIGSINWGLVGIFDWNLVSAIFGAGVNVGSTIIYIVVFMAWLWLVFSIFYQKKKIVFCPEQNETLAKKNYSVK